MKNNDPMIELAGLMKRLIENAKEEKIFLGSVKSTAPFEVKCKNMILDKDDLMICGYLKDALDAKMTFENKYKYKINAGDNVVMLLVGEKFIIIDKVVRV